MQIKETLCNSLQFMGQNQNLGHLKTYNVALQNTVDVLNVKWPFYLTLQKSILRSCSGEVCVMDMIANFTST